MSDLDRFELFTHVVEQGSLTRAAQRLDYTKAAISKQIKRLEADFSINLFTRHKQRLLLTPEGEQLYQQCLRLRNELNCARSICHSLHSEPEGDMHIIAFEHFAKKIIFPKLRLFMERYPKVNLRIDTTERVPNFVEEHIDLAIGFSLPVPNEGEVIQKKMAETRYALCATPRYWEEFGKPCNLKELEDHRYICHSSRDHRQVIRLKQGHHCYLKPALYVNRVDSMIACAMQNLGVMQLPYYRIDGYLERGDLVEVLKEFQECKTAVFYHYPKNRYMQPKVKKFIEFFLKEPIIFSKTG